MECGFGSAACLREGSVFMVRSLGRVKEAMAAMPRSEVNVQPLPSLPDLHHSHVPEHIANWLAGGCSLAHIVLFFVAFQTFGECSELVYLGLISLLNLLHILSQRHLGRQCLLRHGIITPYLRGK